MALLRRHLGRLQLIIVGELGKLGASLLDRLVLLLDCLALGALLLFERLSVGVRLEQSRSEMQTPKLLALFHERTRPRACVHARELLILLTDRRLVLLAPIGQDPLLLVELLPSVCLAKVNARSAGERDKILRDLLRREGSSVHLEQRRLRFHPASARHVGEASRDVAVELLDIRAGTCFASPAQRGPEHIDRGPLSGLLWQHDTVVPTQEEVRAGGRD